MISSFKPFVKALALCALLALAVPSDAGRVLLTFDAKRSQKTKAPDAFPQEKLSPSHNGKVPAPTSLAFKADSNGTHITHAASKQPGGSVTETSYDNWFQRLGTSIWCVIIGIILIIFSFPCMWINERQAARFESLIEVGKEECNSVGFDKAKPENSGCLVHVSGTKAEGKKLLQDDRFPAFKFDSKCLRIVSSVEAYQWVQHEHKEKRKDLVGGGETTVTTYTYTREWKDEKIDSSTFKKAGHGNGLAKPEMSLGSQKKACSVVHYGAAFQLPEDMVSQLDNFQDASSFLGNKANGFTKDGAYYFFPPRRKDHPRIGDMRAQFKYIPDGPVTAFALQASNPKAERETFLPYRLVSRGYCCCTVNDDQLKTLQIKEGQKTPDDLYADDKCSCGPFNLCFYCCVGICNLVTWIFSQGILEGLPTMTPQIYHLFNGNVDIGKCWNSITAQANNQKWIMRAFAWFLMLLGLNLTFEPLFVVIDIVPLLGPYLSNFIEGVVFFLSIFVTLAISSMVMSIAYLFYRPLLGMLYLAGATICIVVPVVIIQATKTKSF